MKEPSVLDVVNSISDDKSLILLDNVAAQPAKTEDLKRISELTRKRYYSRISSLIDSGIVTRIHGGEYQLTLFGKIVHEALKCIGKAAENYWKLAAIDSIESSLVFNGHRLPAEERNRIIDTLIEGNDEIKETLLGNYRSRKGKDAPQTSESKAPLQTAL